MSSADSSAAPAPAPADLFYKIASKDNVEFRISEKAAQHSETIRSCISNLGYTTDNVETMGALPLPKVDGKVLKLVVDWLEHHKDEEPIPNGRKTEEIVITSWDAEFLAVDEETMHQLISAANYLDIRQLLEVACKTVADWLRGHTPGVLRANFNADGNAQ